MNVSVSELSPVERELRVEIPWETVSRAMEQRYGELRRSARPMRGFRPGKVPRWVLEQQFGPMVQAEVAGKLVSEALIKAIEERDLSPVATPTVDPGEIKNGQPFAFTARLEVRPDIKELAFDGLRVERPIREVTDADVTEQIERLREEAASVRPPVPARPARAGDVLVVSYEVRTPDKDEPQRKVDEQEVELGKGGLLEKVEEALIGVSPGDTKVVDVEFPDLSKPETEEKKQVSFHMTVKDVREKVLPEVDDEFAKDVSEHETLLELRLAVRKQLEKGIEEAAKGVVRDRVIDAFVDANPVAVPPSLVQSQSEQTQAELARMLQLDPDKSPFGEEQIGRITAQAERKVRAALLLGALADQEKLAVSDEDVDARLAELAEQSGQPLPKVRAEFGKGDRREHLRNAILHDRVVDLLLTRATIIDKAPEEEPSEDAEAPLDAAKDGATDEHA